MWFTFFSGGTEILLTLNPHQHLLALSYNSQFLSSAINKMSTWAGAVAHKSDVAYTQALGGVPQAPWETSKSVHKPAQGTLLSRG